MEMRTTAPIVLLILTGTLLSGCVTRPMPVLCRPIPHFDDSALDVVIPSIKLEKATVEQALKTVQREWERQVPDEKLPVVILVNQPGIDETGAAAERESKPGTMITLEAKEISVRSLLRILSQLAGQSVRIRSGAVIIEDFQYLGEGWETALVPVSKEGQAFLQLTASTSLEELTALLGKYGIASRAGFSATWNPALAKIVITNLPEEIAKLRELLWLIDNGYDIKRSEVRATQRME